MARASRAITPRSASQLQSNKSTHLQADCQHQDKKNERHPDVTRKRQRTLIVEIDGILTPVSDARHRSVSSRPHHGDLEDANRPPSVSKCPLLVTLFVLAEVGVLCILAVNFATSRSARRHVQLDRISVENRHAVRIASPTLAIALPQDVGFEKTGRGL